MKNIFRKFCSKYKRGYTLLEILVVLVIVGVLVSISIVTYNKLIRRSRVADGMHVLEMLANAQDKYFVEHGNYAVRIGDLKAPIHKLIEGSDGAQHIVTTNFQYSKEPQAYCLKAIARHNDNYTLIKNYKTQTPMSCVGEGCERIDDYVGAPVNMADVCPAEQECNKDQETCGEQHFWSGLCECKCKHSDVLTCPGHYSYENCECDENVDLNEVCVNGDTKPYKYGYDCRYMGPIPLYGANPKAGATDPHGQGTEVSTTTILNSYCGVERISYICEQNEWVTKKECIYKGDFCRESGQTLNPETCQCEKECDENIPHSVSDICGMHIHPIEICNPCINSSPVNTGSSARGKVNVESKGNIQVASKGLSGGKSATNNSIQEVCCGYRLTDGNAVQCNKQTGQWQCVNNNPCISGDGSEVGKPCDGTGTADSQCGILKYDRCKFNDSFSGVDVITTCQLNTAAGNECFDGETKPCISRPGYIYTCENCKWSSDCVIDPNAEHCADQPQPESYAGRCGTISYNCERDDDGSHGGGWYWAPTGFIPDGDNECETGQTTTQGCPEGQQKVCEDCHWSECAPEDPEGPCICDVIPAIFMTVAGTHNCLKYVMECVRDEETHQCRWQQTENYEWVRDYGEGQNCVTGTVIPCAGGAKGGNLGYTKSISKGGNKGGAKGMVDPCCDFGCQDNCRNICAPGGQHGEVSIYQQCISDCIVDNGGYCNSGNNPAVIPGIGDDSCGPYPCEAGYYWNFNVCNCLPRPTGGDEGGEAIPLKYCINCHYTECSYCDPSQEHSDYQTQCALYKASCWEEAGEWVDGQDYYNPLMSDHYGTSNSNPNISWYGDNNCETGQWKYCGTNNQGKRYCNDCHWGDCIIPNYSVSNKKIIVKSTGSYQFCPDGVLTENSNYLVCGNDDIGCDLYNVEQAYCRGNNVQNISTCNIPSGNTYTEYCTSHPGTKCLVNSASVCVASGSSICCGYCGNFMSLIGDNCSAPYDCAKNVEVLECRS